MYSRKRSIEKKKMEESFRSLPKKEKLNLSIYLSVYIDIYILKSFSFKSLECRSVIYSKLRHKKLFLNSKKEISDFFIKYLIVF